MLQGETKNISVPTKQNLCGLTSRGSEAASNKVLLTSTDRELLIDLSENDHRFRFGQAEDKKYC